MTFRTLTSLLAFVAMFSLCQTGARAATLLASQQFPGGASSIATGGISQTGASPRAGAVPIPTGSAPQPASNVSSSSAAAFSGQVSQPSSPPPAQSSQAQSSAPQTSMPSASASPSASPSGSSASASGASRVSGAGSVSAPALPRLGRRPQGSAASASAPSLELDPSVYGGKGVASHTTPSSFWSVDASWGWFNRYNFRGLDVLESVSPDGGGGVSSSRINIAYLRPNDAFLVGLGYVQSLEQQLTASDAALGKQMNREFGRAQQDERYRLAPEDRYAETNLYFAYSRNLVPDVLRASVGYNRYHFSNSGFWADSGGPIDASNEAFVRFDFPGVPFVQPSITYVREFEGFIGSFVEARLEGDFPLGRLGSVPVGLRPYLAASYDVEYNGEDAGWNALEYGVSVPVQLTDSITVSLNANYVQGLEDTLGPLGATPRVSPGFWGGVVVSGSWGSDSSGGSASESFTSFGKGGKYEVLPTPNSPWEVSVGSGFRRVSAGFSHSAAPSFAGFGGLLNPESDRGDLGLASIGSGRDYANGSVSAGAPDGTAVTSGGRAVAPGTGAEQRLFQSFGYTYDNRSVLSNISAQDDDGVLFPYLQLDREVWSSGRSSLRVGLLYSFTNAESDSGYQLGRLDQTFQTQRTHTFIYDNSSFAPLPFGNVVVDGSVFGPPNGFGASFPDPQEAVLAETTEVVKVGSFLQSRLSVDAHDLSLPFDFQYQIAEHLRFEFSVAPTLSLVNARLDTTVEHRRLSPSRVSVFDASNNSFQNRIQSPGSVRSVSSPSTTPSSNTPDQVEAPTPQLGGGRSGRVYTRPDAPGTLLGTDQFASSQSDALFGFSTAAKVVLDLNDEGTVFIDLWGRYQHVDSTSVSNGLGSAEVDLSGWQLGSGIGFKF